jgi:DtxR family transcriptional regulator, Mn-dependent transcriptional regulator
MQGVRLPTARHAVDCLRDAGLVLQESYGLITLTPDGHLVGRSICDRFDLTRKFLIEILGVDDEAAESEACTMEHHLDDDTLNRLAAFVKNVTACASGTGAECLLSLKHDFSNNNGRS